MDKSSGEDSIPPSAGPSRIPFFCASRVITALLVVFLLFNPLSALAFDLESRVKEFTLDNGLKVLFLERKGAPIFAAHMAFKVGSVEELAGHTGAAHMLEHMLFKGTTRIGTTDWGKEEPLLEKVDSIGEQLDIAVREGKDQNTIENLRAELNKALEEEKKYIAPESYSKIYAAEGGVGHNAGTSWDTTTYIIRLPSNKFELWARLEADRLENAVLREYYAERDVVLEELRRSYENNPDGKLFERFMATAYTTHPYGRPVIGLGPDISLLSISEVKRFLNAWYVPNNAVIAIVGDLKFEEVQSVITKYFGFIPSRPLPERVVAVEPPQQAERRVDVEFDASPTLMMGFHKPNAPHADDYVFSVIDSILTLGRTGRMDRSLAQKKKVALSVGSFVAPGDRYPNMFIISAEPRPPHSTRDVEKAVWEELERLKTAPVSKKELEKVVNNMEADYVRQLQSHYGMARLLTHYQVVTGDWRDIIKEMEKIKAVTPEDIQRVAGKYFTRDNLTVGSIVRDK